MKWKNKLLEWSFKSEKRFCTFWSTLIDLAFLFFLSIIELVKAKEITFSLVIFVLETILFIQVFVFCYFGIFLPIYVGMKRKIEIERKKQKEEELRKHIEKEMMPKPDTEGMLD